MARKIAESIEQPMSQTRLLHTIKSTGENISLPALKDYLDYMQDAFLTFSIPNLASPLTERSTTVKRYFSDNGLLNVFFTSEEGKLLENIVAITLYQRFNSIEESQVFYYNKNIEVDFCVPKEKLAIQVTLKMDNVSTYEREVSALDKFIAVNPQYKGIIITLDEEQTIQSASKIDIEVIPVWKWVIR
ncbi:MAG: ATP-binding protein [Bacteroidales bacterium]|nr:ATP-binding protein [Bacteroidales bacterium]